ncbi:MAG: hypothetical protein Tsb002_34620 [Wenzhouxiangellaceae bacterium]
MRKTLLLASIAALATAGQAQAGPRAGEWYFGLNGGSDFNINGNVHGGANAAIPDLGGLNPDLNGVAATLAIEPRDYGDIYGAGWTINGELGYGISDNWELFTALSYGELSAGIEQVGGAIVPALNSTLPVFGDFEDYTYWRVDLGTRFYFGDSNGLQPFVGARAGIAFVDDISASFSIPDANITINDAAFYNSSNVFSGGIEVGLAYIYSDSLEFRLTAAAQYTASLNDDDNAISGLGLSTINDLSERWSLPVTAGFVLRY